MLMESALKMPRVQERHGFFGYVVSESVHGGWPCMLDRVCEHGSHACMIPMHVGGWLWDSYGDEHGMGMVGMGLMGLELMDWVAGFSERNEATVWVQRGDGVGSIKVVDLGKSPPANAAGWNYMNAVLENYSLGVTCHGYTKSR
ncbi:hypothetical protein AAG906_021890 [Vitis piasezkii]